MANLTLAITTIGDLLLEQRITRNREGKAITDVELAIPDYQRPYKWTARNAIQLLDDIIEAKNANKEVYRVGTLILNQEGGVYNIVDGQQRSITFALLLLALYELEAPGDRREIALLEQRVFDNVHSRRNIPNNLNALRRRTARRREDGDKSLDHIREMQRLRDYIESQCELIVVITDDISEAFQFFDSQNARGKALYPHDLLKAFHLREMRDEDADKTETIVKEWEIVPQGELASFFGDYLYRLKEWVNGNWAYELDEHNIHKFKGITKSARTPFAQFYKSAYSYATFINASAMPFVSGGREVNAFQINAPIIAGKPFFDYTKHYYEILQDIRTNSKYEGFYVKDNIIVRTLDKYFNKGTGDRATRLLFDTAMLLYVDRFCPPTYPTQTDTDLFEQFVVAAFVWAYSLRAQYDHLGWQSAQNYILGRGAGNRRLRNSFNIYKLISDCDTPIALLSALADALEALDAADLKISKLEEADELDAEGVYKHYFHFFKMNDYYTE